MNKTYIVIHHSLTKDSETVSWGAIRDYHLAKGWTDIGYHFGLEQIGKYNEILFGRLPYRVGAHTKELNMNRVGLGICVVGNFDETPPSESTLTKLRSLVLWLMDDYEVPSTNVVGHRDVGLMAGFDWKKGQYKSCPGTKFDMQKFRQSLTDV